MPANHRDCPNLSIVRYRKKIKGDFDLGAKIKSVRLMRGLSQKQLAVLTGVTPSTISQVEKNLIYPSLPALFRIAESLSVEAATFLKGHGLKKNAHVHSANQRSATALEKVPRGAADAELLLGNGSDELIQMILLTLAQPGRVVLSVDPGFVMYRMIAGFVGMDYVGVPLAADFSLDTERMLEAIEELITIAREADIPCYTQHGVGMHEKAREMMAEFDSSGLVSLLPALVGLEHGQISRTRALPHALGQGRCQLGNVTQCQVEALAFQGVVDGTRQGRLKVRNGKLQVDGKGKVAFVKL